MQAILVFQWDSRRYKVKALQRELACRPDPKAKDEAGKPIGESIPVHRFPSTATPSFFCQPPPEVKTEDDVIYRPNLPRCVLPAAAGFCLLTSSAARH
jgi:hypothetical protein